MVYRSTLALIVPLVLLFIGQGEAAPHATMAANAKSSVSKRCDFSPEAVSAEDVRLATRCETIDDLVNGLTKNWGFWDDDVKETLGGLLHDVLESAGGQVDDIEETVDNIIHEVTGGEAGHNQDGE